MNIESERAKHAEKRLSTRVGKFPGGINSDAFEMYRTVLRSAALEVQQLGLLQTAAFWLSKRKDKEGYRPARFAEVQVLEDLVDWLRHCLLTQGITSKSGSPFEYSVEERNAASFAEALLACSGDELAVLEREAVAYLTWLARLTEGRYREREQQQRTEQTK